MTATDIYGPHVDLNATQIAKLIRTDLRAAQKAGVLDASLRFSVRTEYFSGGSAIDVTVKGFTGATHRPEWLDWDKSGVGGLPPVEWKTPEVKSMTDAVKAVCAARLAGRYTYNTIYVEQTGGLVYA